MFRWARMVCVRSATFNSGTTASLNFRIYSDIIADVLFSIGAPVNGSTCINPGVCFPISSARGSFQFTLQDATGAQLVANAGNAQLFFQLEFSS